MQRAIELKRKAEKHGGFTYDLVVVSRWDVLWARPMLFSKIDVSADAFNLPTYCTHAHHVDHRLVARPRTPAGRLLFLEVSQHL